MEIYKGSNMKFNYTFLAISLVTTPVMAKLSDESGFSGEISFNSGFSGETSNFNTDGDKTITTKGQSADSDSRFMAFPLGSLAYTFGQNLDKQLYIGTARKDIAVGKMALEIAYKQELNSGTVVNVSFLPTIMPDETWANPYLLDTERTTTDEAGYAYHLKVSKIAGSNFSLDAAYVTKELENEVTLDELKRDSNIIYLKTSYRLFLNRTSFLKPSITYMRNDAEGSAASYDLWKTEISYLKLFDRQQLALTVGYENSSYDTGNVIFDNKMRSDNTLSLFLAYKYKKLMNLDDWSFVSFVGYNHSNSSITFYDRSNYIVSFGLNYAF
jgi:hypothetical protein